MHPGPSTRLMKAIQLEKPQSLRLITIPDPPNPGPGEALVRVHRAAFCGTDFAMYLGRMPGATLPRILGHELGVEVLALGQGTGPLQVGDRCAVEPYLNDPGSFATRNGHPNCCENLRVLGVHIDGGLRSRLLLPARKLHRVQNLSYDQAALVELLAVGHHAVERSRCRPGEQVLVIGAGPVGLSIAVAVQQMGGRVILMDPDVARLDQARQRLGAVAVIQVLGDDSDLQRVEQCTGGHLARHVFESTGSFRLIQEAPRYCAHAGTVILVALSNQELALPHALLHRRELTLMTSRNALPTDFQAVIAALESGAVDVRGWITHTASFQEAIGEFGKWLNPATGVVRAMVSL